MADIQLTAQPRDGRGTRESRRMRTAGRIPGVVYGHGSDPVAVSVDARELRHALTSKAGANALFDLLVGSERHLAMARDMQHHPVRRTISHVDFLIVGRDELITAEVPIEFVGEAVSVNRQDGTVEHLMLSVVVKAKPADIPAAITVDVSALEIGDSVTVGGLVLPAGVSIESDPDTAVAIAQPPRSVSAPGDGGAEPGGGAAESA